MSNLVKKVKKKEKTEITNDQGEIIELIKQKRYKEVWPEVMYIGYNDMPDANERMMAFIKIIQKFDYNKSNNFIYYYKNNLNLQMKNRYQTFYVTQSRTIVNKLKRQLDSPTYDNENSYLVKEFKHWHN